MMEYLEEHPDVDIIAPELVNLPWLYTSHRRESLLFTGALPPLRPFGEVVAGAVIVPKVANVFLARTDSLREVGWDERLRLVEHRDFFSRASDVWSASRRTGCAHTMSARRSTRTRACYESG